MLYNTYVCYITHVMLCWGEGYITHVMLYNTCYITHDMLCYITHHMLFYITDDMLCYVI